MATKTAKKKPAAATPERLTDEELTVLIKGFLSKLPDATVHGVYKTLRASGKSVSGGRVRTVMAALAAKPKARKPAASK
jgi:hypothetical protein